MFQRSKLIGKMLIFITMALTLDALHQQRSATITIFLASTESINKYSVSTESINIDYEKSHSSWFTTVPCPHARSSHSLKPSKSLSRTQKQSILILRLTQKKSILRGDCPLAHTETININSMTHRNNQY